MFRNNKAFTLIELMVVIVIIGILATLAIPKFNEASLKAKVSEAPTVLSSFDNAQLAYLAETNTLGVASVLAMNDPAALTSKYYTYDGTTAGTCQGTTAGTGMGDVASLTINTVVGTGGLITHGKHTNFDKYLPNWD